MNMKPLLLVLALVPLVRAQGATVDSNEVPGSTSRADTLAVPFHEPVPGVPEPIADTAASPSSQPFPAKGDSALVPAALPASGDTSSTGQDSTDSVTNAPRGPRVPLTVRSSAPVDAVVSIEDEEVQVDSTTRWSLTVQVDSAVRASGSVDLCLRIGTQKACSPLRPQGFDTLEIAPLAMRIDTVIEKRDTLIVRDTAPDTAFHANAPIGAQKVQGEGATKTVVVKAKRRPPHQMGVERVTVQTIKQMPGLAEPDVIRAVQALPGVVQSSDFSTKIYVRGSSSDQNLVLFDNAVVYSPSHFGGLFGAFLADAVGGLEFSKGGFDSRYGNRLASVLQVASKNGGYDQDSGRSFDTWLKGSARLTTFGGSAAIEGHKGDFSWVYAGRRSWVGEVLGLARDAGVTDLNIGYYFYDQQGSAVWGRGGDSVRVSLYQGRDSLTLSPIALEWGNFALPVNVRKRLLPGLAYRGSFSWSAYDQTFAFAGLMKMTNEIRTLGTRQELVWDAGSGHQLTGGYEYNDFDVTFAQEMPIVGSRSEEKPKTALHAFYAQDRWVLNPQWTLTGGLRGSSYPETDELAFDPRATATWRFAPNWKADLHAGYYHQYLTSIRFTNMEMPTEFWYPVKGDLPSTKQGLLAMGVERSEWGPWKLRVGLEGYWKDLRDFLVYYPNGTASEEAGSDQFAKSMATARGWSTGGELSIAKEDGPWTGSLSYALGWSVLRQDPFTNALGTTTFDPFWADWDQRQTFKASATAVWLGDGANSFWKSRKPRFFLRSTLQLNYNTGTPFTGYDGYASTHLIGQGYDGASSAGQPAGLENNTYVAQGYRNNERKPNYFRADLTLLDVGRTGSWRVYYTIINLTNHDNVYNIAYNTSETPPKKEVTSQFPILPVFLGVEVEF